MALQSMTGFARFKGEHKDLSWCWELRSVNGKGLDVRLKLPSGFEALEIKARAHMSNLLNRGNIQVSLQITQHQSNVAPEINQDNLDGLIAVAKKLQTQIGGELPSLTEFMQMRGVLEFIDQGLSDEEIVARDQELLEGLHQAASALVDMRVSEGREILVVLKSNLEKIAELRDQIENNKDRTPEAINMQLVAQVKKLIAANETLDPQRLHQEAVILAAKADLKEELDRLSAHIKAARELLSGNGPIGRKLDFLAQEFNRECNTICSKSNSADITATGLDMKLVIDQFREQVQNME